MLYPFLSPISIHCLINLNLYHRLESAGNFVTDVTSSVQKRTLRTGTYDLQATGRFKACRTGICCSDSGISGCKLTQHKTLEKPTSFQLRLLTASADHMGWLHKREPRTGCLDQNGVICSDSGLHLGWVTVTAKLLPYHGKT